MLHLIQKSPFQTQCLRDCLNIAQRDDSFLLMQDGVYALQQTDFINSDKRIFALEEDIKARGLTITTQDNVASISYEQFVILTTEHDKVLSWY